MLMMVVNKFNVLFMKNGVIMFVCVVGEEKYLS